MENTTNPSRSIGRALVAIGLIAIFGGFLVMGFGITREYKPETVKVVGKTNFATGSRGTVELLLQVKHPKTNKVISIPVNEYTWTQARVNNDQVFYLDFIQRNQLGIDIPKRETIIRFITLMLPVWGFIITGVGLITLYRK